MTDNNIYNAPKAEVKESINREELEKVLTVANRQRSLLLTFAAYMITIGVSTALNANQPINSVYYSTILGILLIILMLAVIVFTFRLVSQVYGIIFGIIMILLSVVPIINLLVILAASSRASKLIKKNGFKIGIAGANIKSIKTAIDECPP